ncbi:MAG: hypothetical protein DRP13_04200 [Candidatus Aenigmatarchaeota archaeon]|nr:MAG: hypothetical protein DRP18_05475 [Candidatus Aenigmarchaeota archaeon]RLJ07192.1 MAG: hypothetical protein DRP13_04200 [Candidatus Aenigmarchaeota archaeon]
MNYDFLHAQKTKIKRKHYSILIIAFLISAGYFYYSSNTSVTTLENTQIITEMPIATKINNNYVLTIGEETPLIFNFTTPGNYWNAKIQVSVPKGLELLKGDLKWEGNLVAEKTRSLAFYVRAVKVGKWETKISIKDSSGKTIKDHVFNVCIDVLEKDAIKRCVS